MSRLTTVLIYVLLVFNEVITSTQALYVKKEGISQRRSTSLVLLCVTEALKEKSTAAEDDKVMIKK